MYGGFHLKIFNFYGVDVSFEKYFNFNRLSDIFGKRVAENTYLTVANMLKIFGWENMRK
jgi:hypothetical protein